MGCLCGPHKIAAKPLHNGLAVGFIAVIISCFPAAENTADA